MVPGAEFTAAYQAAAKEGLTDEVERRLFTAGYLESLHKLWPRGVPVNAMGQIINESIR